MHDYSIDQHPKQKIIFGLSFLAIVVAPWINRLLSLLSDQIPFISSPVVSSIPVFGLFMGIFWLFDNKLWKHEFIRRFLLVPDLNGKWKVHGRTVSKEGEAVSIDWSGELSITQSWSKMVMRLVTKTSTSESKSASIVRKEGDGYHVTYHYENRPNVDSANLLFHIGTAEIKFDASCQNGSGFYYTSKERTTTGSMKLERI